MTQQEGNTTAQIKYELSQLGDSSILTFTDLVVLLVFKHMQEWGKKNECLYYFFSPQKDLSMQIKLQNIKKSKFYLGSIQHIRVCLKSLMMPGHNLLQDHVYLLGTWAFPTISRTITNAISCWNASFISSPFWCVSPSPRWPWSWPEQEKKHPKVCFLLLISLLLFQWNCAVTKREYNTFQMPILYQHGVFSLQDLSAA